MEAMRESWTDERLDDFRAETARRFDSVDKRFDSVERRMEAGFNRLDSRIDGLHETIHRTMLQLGGGLIVTVAVGFAGIIVTQL